MELQTRLQSVEVQMSTHCPLKRTSFETTYGPKYEYPFPAINITEEGNDIMSTCFSLDRLVLRERVTRATN